MAGNYDPNKDYAAAIKKETDPAKKQQLISERQNKIDAMNAAGTNKNNYSNDIYNGGGNNSTGNKNNSSGGNKGSGGGYFDPNKDYAEAIRAETDPVKRQQLISERENKINAMNAAGTNTGGYTNDIYKTPGNGSFGSPAAPVAKGQYQSQDAVINNAALNTQQQARINLALANDQQGEAMQINPVATIDYQQVLNNTTDPVQKAALQAYFTRMQANIRPEDTQGVYGGDTTMSLPDQALLRAYQQNYNDAKARGDTAAMNLAHRAAENLRDNYRYYPTANSNGYNLGENDIGWIRDIVVRVDDLGNKYVDQYNQGTVTTTKYDKDGNFVNQLKGAKIAGHDDFVARQWDRAVENGNEDRWTAIRIADANDVNLSASELMAKYGAQGGMGRDLYGDARINGKIANGMTGAGTAIGQNGGVGTVANTAANGYFDPNKDYAAAIKNASSTQEMLQLQQERENKINWMNQNGQNPNGYTNQIYSNYQNIQSAPAAGQMVQQAAIPEYQGMTKDELYEGYNEAAENLEAQRKALLNLTLQQSQAAQDQANTGYDEMARQAYILRRQQEMALPQQLAAMGISGGGSETANLQLAANYQNNLNANEQQRQQMMKDYALQKLQAQTQANSDIAGYYADAQQNAMGAWQNEMANQNAWNQWAASYQQGLREYQDQLNNLTYDQLQANKEQQINLALQLGDYNKLKALGYDTTYLKRMQDAELEKLALDALYSRAQIAKVNGSVKSGSGGGTKKSSGGGRSSSKSKDSDGKEKEMELGNKVGSSWIYVPGYGRIGDSEIEAMIDNGTVKETVRNGKIYYVKA